MRASWLISGCVLLTALSSCVRLPILGRDRSGTGSGRPLQPMSPEAAGERGPAPVTPAPAAAPGMTPELIERRPPRPLAPIDPAVQRASPIVPPRWAAPSTPVAPAEGAMIVDRAGRLGREEATGRWRFTFDPAAGQPALPIMEVLPSSFLAEMEKMVAQSAPRPVTFHVTAEVTRYRGRAHLMIRKALAEYLVVAERAEP